MTRHDILIVAIGRAKFVTADMVNRGPWSSTWNQPTEAGLVGDVDFDGVKKWPAITPVPGGVGPLTITMILHNTIAAARLLTR